MCFRRSLDPSLLSFPRTFCTCSVKGAHDVHSGANRSCSRQSLHHASPEWRRPLQYRLVPGTFFYFFFFLFFFQAPLVPVFLSVQSDNSLPTSQKKKKNRNQAHPESVFYAYVLFVSDSPALSSDVVAPPTFLTAMT